MYSRATDILGKLRLPEAALQLRAGTSTKDFDVYDPIRRLWVALTPEEWVRQHFVHYLVERCGVSAYRIANEVSLKLNSTSRRADTVIYDDNLRPAGVVEYKAADIPLSRNVLEQVLRYNLVFDAPGLIVTNGLDAFTIVGENLIRGVDVSFLSNQ